jgi:hypothetical protein
MKSIALAAFAAFLAFAAPARADPIFVPLFTTILGATLASTPLIGSVTVATALSAIVTKPVGRGATMLGNAR